MLVRLLRFATALVCFGPASAAPDWTLIKSSHFELYSQSGIVAGRAALSRFEQLRTFFTQVGLKPPEAEVIRVIGFASEKEYEPYRLGTTADAYFVGTDHRNYIVMATLAPDHFWVAAHEYAHLALYAGNLHLPPWLSEGLAEFFSTVHISERDCTLGGDIPMRSQTLRLTRWLPLEQLLDLPADAPLRNTRDGAALFYAESWALTDMLALSPLYTPQFRQLVTTFASGERTHRTLVEMYKKPLGVIEHDLHVWVERHLSSFLALPGIATESIVLHSATVSTIEVRSLLADLQAGIGHLDLAEASYRSLLTESPKDAKTEAALGAVRLREGDREGARREWKRAFELGIDDAMLCYRYAELADEAGLSSEEIRPALERAVALKPDFDDARYKLALLEGNSADYQAAAENLLKMRSISSGRAYGYWSALANAFNELGSRDEANQAAGQALIYAHTEAERAHARELAYISQTDLAVQFTHDSEGRAQLVTTRVPHNSPDHNPFIEPGDHIRRLEAELKEIRCKGNRITQIVVTTAHGALTVSVSDPTHVLMRNAPMGFTCGPQQPSSVIVDYAASWESGAATAGVLRGMEFR